VEVYVSMSGVTVANAAGVVSWVVVHIQCFQHVPTWCRTEEFGSHSTGAPLQHRSSPNCSHRMNSGKGCYLVGRQQSVVCICGSAFYCNISFADNSTHFVFWWIVVAIFVSARLTTAVKKTPCLSRCSVFISISEYATVCL